jgi:glycosyltransferase involved in cell wall biosynthesis
MRKLLVITDMDSGGSGYRNICTPLLTELSKMEYEIKVIGFSNRGEEHNHPFSILPANMLEEAIAMAGNLCHLWNPDVIIVAMDLPIQARFHSSLQQFLVRPDNAPKRKYIAITPLENGPLCLSWAAPLFPMDAVFFISELGKQEALKVGVRAEHLQIGVDTVSWRPAFPEEKKQLRDGLGIPQDAFVVLTVADNQERKNLWAAMEAISQLKKEITVPLRYVLVTREDSPVGWRLRDLAVTLGINQEYLPFNRGMPQRDLWGLYAASDVYLQTSKAEGLGLPVLDAMCMKVPVIATDTGALHELLEDGRGYLVSPEYTFTDVWGNSKRDMVSISKTSNSLFNVALRNGNALLAPETAYEWVSKRTWDIPAKQIHNKIEELCNEPQK